MDEHRPELAAVIADVATAAAQLTPVTAVAAGLVTAVRDRKMRRRLLFIEALLEHHAAAIDDLRRCLSEDRVLEVLSAALTASEESHTDDKVMMLAEIAGETIRPDAGEAKVDAGQYLVDVIAALEPVDVVALQAVARPRGGAGQFAGHRVIGGLTAADIGEITRQQTDLINVALARLTAAGLIENQATGRYGGNGPSESYGPTPAGEWVVDWLDRLQSS